MARHFFSIAMLFSLSVIPTYGFAGIDSISSAINKAGRQRMLTQRIVATYSQIGQEITTQKSQRQLRGAIDLFEQQLSELKEYRQSGKINEQLQRVTKSWDPIQKIAREPVQKSKAEELRILAEDALKASHRVVIMLQDESGTKKGELVNISGRQRMLSQRLSNLYMLQSWGFTSSEYTNDYSRALNEFKGALTELSSSTLSTKEINEKLNKARREFGMFERSSHHKNGEFIPLMIKMSADKLLTLMNDITHLYEQLETENEVVSLSPKKKSWDELRNPSLKNN
ncbi:MAG: type IV pili methyl-accepting chemotaxis transducer N-terminal domain-containing protein [Gammaproteobacteria bacterium]|nr:type IV pili methyl-accepting chemotaxis transducer N-terminal domain-containing protein [Gammaproteobacteria bacterium]